MTRPRSAVAWSIVMPGRSRPNAKRNRPLRSLRSSAESMASGCHISAVTGKPKPSGITPMTTEGAPLTRMVRPTMFGSDA